MSDEVSKNILMSKQTDKGYKIETSLGHFKVMPDESKESHYAFSKKPFLGSEEYENTIGINLGLANIVNAEVGDEIKGPQGSIGILISKKAN